MKIQTCLFDYISDYLIESKPFSNTPPSKTGRCSKLVGNIISNGLIYFSTVHYIIESKPNIDLSVCERRIPWTGLNSQRVLKCDIVILTFWISQDINSICTIEKVSIFCIYLNLLVVIKNRRRNIILISWYLNLLNT